MCLAIAACPAAGPAQAAFPGANGKIAFRSNGAIFVMNADGTGQTNLGNSPAPSFPGADRDPSWSADGTKIAFTSDNPPAGIYVMNADGTGLVSRSPGGVQPAWSPDGAKIANPAHDPEPAWSPDGTKIAFTSERAPGGIFVMNADGTGQLSRSGGAGDKQPAWSPDGTKLAFTRTDEVFVMHADGTGQVNRANRANTFDGEPDWQPLPAAPSSAGLELELESEKLLGSFGTFTDRTANDLQPASLKLTGKQVNCTGFDFTGAEIRADEISFIPKRLRVPRKLGLRNILFKYEERNGLCFWTGQGELILPTGTGELAVGGKVSIADTKLAGVGVSVSGINRSIGYGLFLQSVAGELAFEPDFGFNFGVGATLGPQVMGKKLVKLTGNLKGLALAPECTNGQDPIALVATGSIPLVEELGAGSVKLEGVNCIYTASRAIEQSPKVEAVFGEVVNGEVPRPVVAAKASLSGFVGVDGLNAEGGGSVTIPLVGAVAGQALMSTTAFAACGRVGFFSGGAAHVWGQSRTDAFTGCDLAPWRAGAGGARDRMGPGQPARARRGVARAARPRVGRRGHRAGCGRPAVRRLRRAGSAGGAAGTRHRPEGRALHLREGQGGRPARRGDGARRS